MSNLNNGPGDGVGRRSRCVDSMTLLFWTPYRSTSLVASPLENAKVPSLSVGNNPCLIPTSRGPTKDSSTHSLHFGMPESLSDGTRISSMYLRPIRVTPSKATASTSAVSVCFRS